MFFYYLPRTLLWNIYKYFVHSKSILQTDFFFSKNKAPFWDYRLVYKELSEKHMHWKKNYASMKTIA